MPRVSIITALYNHEKYIAQAIESVLAQTYQDFEHIIWDDGSKDRGLEIAREYAKKHPRKIKVFTHPGGANRGQENTRNAALAKASGEYIAILDSDDYYDRRKLELLVPRLGNNRVGLAYGSAGIFKESTGETLPSGIREEPSGRVFDKLVEENFICVGATLFRKQCVEKGLQFDPQFRTIGEYPLWLKIARDWEFAHVPHVVAYWRDHGENLGTKLALKAKAELVALCERMSLDAEYAEHGPAIARALARKRYDYASELYGGFDLEGTRQQCRLVVREARASSALRAKAAVLYAVTMSGRRINRSLSRLKQKVWELRHPELARKGSRAQRKS